MRIRSARSLVILVSLLAISAFGGIVVAGATGRMVPHGEALVRPAATGGPTGTEALAGPWVERADPGDRGRALGWQDGGFGGRLVTVPYVANAAHITGAAGEDSFKGSIAWYHTSLTAPRTGTYALRFESVHHRASVWLDGRLLGRHVGAYLPFEYHLRLAGGVAHTLVVRADYRFPTRQERTGWHRTWFNFGGINREVTLRPLGASELIAPAIHTRLDHGAALVDLSVAVRNRGTARDVTVTGSLTRAGAAAQGFGFPAVHLGPGQTRRVATTLRVAHPQLWQPGAPHLYALRLRVGDESGYDQQVGLRELRRDGARLYLNGRRLRLHGASINEDAEGRGDGLRPADMDRMVAELQAVGANATRVQHALSPPMLERLDRAGILVWQGVGPVDAPGAWTSESPRAQRLARQRVRITVAQEQPHPSVIAWSLVNELAGNGHDAAERAYVDGLARELHRTDPGRLVAVDVWGTHVPTTPGPMYRRLDAVGLTDYSGWYTDALAARAVIARSVTDTTRAFGGAFPGKVKVISEFGAEANSANASAAPGGFAFQAWLLRRHIATYRAFPAISGMLVWNLRDFGVSPSFAGGSIKREVPHIRLVRGLNQKGLFTYDGRAKPAVAAVRRAYAPLGSGLG